MPRSSLPELARVAPEEARAAALDALAVVIQQHPDWTWTRCYAAAAETFGVTRSEFARILGSIPPES